MACYGDSFAFLCVEDIRPSQEICLRSPLPVAGVALFSYMQMMFYLTENIHIGLHGLLR
jgi:hypothetical protein